MSLTPLDTAKRNQTPPLQGRGKGWGIDANRLAELQRRAKDMRRNPTEPELRLWRHLSNRQLGGFKFRRQDVIGWSIADFCCPSACLVIEVDGDTHDDPEKDATRDRQLVAHGYHVLHFTDHEVIGNMDGVLTTILAWLDAHAPHPNPSPEGEGLKSVR